MLELRVAMDRRAGNMFELTVNKLIGEMSYMVVMGACVFYHVDVKATLHNDFPSGGPSNKATP